MRALIMWATLLALSATPVGTGPSQQAGQRQSAEQELREFVPSEEIRADSAVSFPVDI